MQMQIPKFISTSYLSFIFLLLLIEWNLNVSAQFDRDIQECGIIEEVPGDIRTKVPWTAGIFIRQSPRHPFKFLVGGSVIGPSTIITLLGGSYGAQNFGKKYILPQPENIMVGTGLKSTILNKNDNFTQFSQVNYIVPNNLHPVDNKEYHFFILHLKTPLDLSTPYARALCLFELIFEPVDLENWVGWTTYFSGFTTPAAKDGSLVLKFSTLEITRGSYDLCNSAFNFHYGRLPYHEYCLRLTAGQTSNNTCVLFGSSSVVEVTGIWFLGGMMALIPRRERGQCGAKTLYYFTDLIWCRDWLLRNLKCSPDRFACGNGDCIPLSSVCNNIKDCDDGLDEDPIYCEATNHCPKRNSKYPNVNSYRCHLNGNCINEKQLCNSVSDCTNGTDEIKNICVQHQNIENQVINYIDKKCQPIPKSEGVLATCVNGQNQKINCTNAPINTVATLRCDKYYASKHRTHYVTMTCRDDGFWHPYKTFECEPDCGILTVDIKQPFISRGSIATEDEGFPWHAIIFRLRQGQFQYLCGASLIEKNALVSVAHCVVELGSSRSLINVDELKVVLSPVSSIYNENVVSRRAQILNVENAWIPPTFDPRSLQGDIAIIKLATHVKYTNSIRPICYLPQSSTGIPKPGVFGKVPGFGIDERSELSTRLKYANFPVVNFYECSKSLKMVLRLSTFCAGYKNGTAVCQGDSGGGLVFPERLPGKSFERYVLRGIVSHGELTNSRFCEQYNYAVFTHVDAFSSWILDVLESLDVSSPTSIEEF